jgi:uncharacterized membrane protein
MRSITSKLAVLVAAAVGTALAANQAQAADDQSSTEKCYGVAKAGKNDCQTPASSCAGTNKVDGNGKAFILLPKGSCEKIAGGSTAPKG